MVSLLSVGLLLCVSGLSRAKVILVAPGSDVTLRCEGSWDRISGSSVELTMGRTAHLLVQNFQQADEGLYRCGGEEVHLERKYGSGSGKTRLYRAQGQSVRLFCRALGSGKCHGRWTRPPRQASEVNGGQDNDFSLLIPSVEWGPLREFHCHVNCSGQSLKRSSYELIVVRATVAPERVYEGEAVRLCCSVSEDPVRTPGQVCWINLNTNSESLSRRYRGDRRDCGRAADGCHYVSSVRAESVWACAVFRGDTLRALVPVHISVTQHTTTHTTHTHSRTAATTLQPTHSDSAKVTGDMATQETEESLSPGVSAHHVCIMSVFGLLVLLVAALTSALLWRRTNEAVEVCEHDDDDDDDDDDDGAGGDEGAGESSSSNESVTYTAVHFKRKPNEDLGEDVTATDPLTGVVTMDEEDQTVIYAGLKMNSH